MTSSRVVGSLLWLVLVWTALWGELTLGNVVGGLLVAGGVLWAVPIISRPDAGPSARVHPLAALRYLGFFLWALVRSSAVVAWEVITPGSRIRQGIIALPLRTRSELVATIIANSISLTPGTLTLEIETDPLTLYVHVLHLRDPESVRAELRRLEELAIQAFGAEPREATT